MIAAPKLAVEPANGPTPIDPTPIDRSPIDMTEVYVSAEVAGVLALYPYLADPDFGVRPISEQIAIQANTLVHAHAARDDRIGMQVMSWWPDATGQTLDTVLATTFCEQSARLTVAREYGFPDWETVRALGDLAPDPLFEQAVETMLAGDLSGLAGLIDAAPDLVRQRSRYGHGATLLHYLGSNGVESQRQRVPLNAVDLAGLLIERGAQRSAQAHMYGGQQTPFMLASTSAHPHHAGVSDGLNAVLSTEDPG